MFNENIIIDIFQYFKETINTVMICLKNSILKWPIG